MGSSSPFRLMVFAWRHSWRGHHDLTASWPKLTSSRLLHTGTNLIGFVRVKTIVGHAAVFRLYELSM